MADTNRCVAPAASTAGAAVTAIEPSVGSTVTLVLLVAVSPPWSVMRPDPVAARYALQGTDFRDVSLGFRWCMRGRQEIILKPDVFRKRPFRFGESLFIPNVN